MEIEDTTTYAYRLKYLENPSFNNILGLTKMFIDSFPQKLIDELNEGINQYNGILSTEPQMLVYLHTFGKLHQMKLNVAFDNVPKAFFEQPEINIIDYSCGQAIGTMCYADYIKEHNYTQRIKSVSLIEPSEICIKRAALHVSKFFTDTNIHTINKNINNLSKNDINCEADIPTLHILSNVLFSESYLKRFTAIINDNLKGYNQFVCFGHYLFLDKDERMDDISSRLNGVNNYCNCFDEKALCIDTPWTSQIRCFSVGDLNSELSSNFTNEDIKNEVIDELSVCAYNKIGIKLLRCYNFSLAKSYDIKNGTKIICNHAFSYKVYAVDSPLQIITIPNSLKVIGDYAFAKCKLIERIEIPNSVISIGRGTFLKCNSLKEISISNSIRSIENQTFLYCRSLLQITIPDSVTYIGNNAFGGCSALQQITIPESVTYIGNNAFSDCHALQQITIPESVTFIGHGTFGGCSALQQINIPESITNVCDYVFNGCISLKQITIPNTVTYIGEGAFKNCRALEQISIPKSVKHIGVGAFRGCTSLQHVIIEDNTNYYVQNNMLIDAQNNVLLLYFGKEKKVVIPDYVKIIGKYAFEQNSSLQEISISSSVTTIEPNAFKKCLLLSTVDLDEEYSRLDCIGYSAFQGCKSLTNISIPSSIMLIDQNAFSDCSSLSLITFGGSCTTIGDEVFSNCTSLMEVNILGAKSIGNNIFQDCKLLRKVSFPYYCDHIGECSFRGHQSLQQITLPRAYHIIEEHAFDNCIALIKVDIPYSVTEIKKYAFSGCESLQNINIPQSVKLIGEFAFNNCVSLPNVIIPNSVSHIEGAAFKNCVSIQNIIIPNSVISIEDSAFAGCTALKQVYLPHSLKHLGAIFEGVDWMDDELYEIECPSLERIIISQDSVEQLKKLVPKKMWHNIYYLAQAIEDSDEINLERDCSIDNLYLSARPLL